MKIALIYPGCHKKGGVERVLLEFANFLEVRGHEVHVFTAKIDSVELHPGVITHLIPLLPIPYVSRYFLFSKKVKKAIEKSLVPDTTVTFGVETHLDGILIVGSVHKAWLEISRRKRGLMGRLKQFLNPAHYFIMARAKTLYGKHKYRKLIAAGEQVKADLMRLYRISGEDIVAIPNGFSPNEFHAKNRLGLRVLTRQKLGYGNPEKVILFAANELDRKGFGQLVKAIGSLNDPNVYLLVVGKNRPGPYGALLRKLKLSARVRFAGSTNDMASYYAAADIFALPTQYDPGPLVVVEALASGLPVLTSKLAGSSIAVLPGKTGELLEDPWDVAEITLKLKRLLDGGHVSPEEISESVKDFSWDIIFSRYEKVLMENRNPASSRPRGEK